MEENKYHVIRLEFQGREEQVTELQGYLNLEADGGYFLDRTLEYGVSSSNYLIVITKHD